jgi:hypothetical protein
MMMETAGVTSSIGDQAEDVVRRVRAVGEELSGLAAAIGSIASSVQERIDLPRRLRNKPASTLLIAAGVGYVAGGGLFTSTTARLLKFGARLWLLPAINRRLTQTTNRQEYH